uniref:palmitoyl-protein hydrolase n=1 Tax=Romanomermis culicivorax TaxID=13658 RepID=A0A915HN52_ROMCU
MGYCFSKSIESDQPTDEQQFGSKIIRSPSSSSCLTKQKSTENRMASSCVSPVVIAATARHTATVIFMHGLGDTGHGWAPVFQQIRSPHVKYVLPTAPTMPVTLNMGMHMPSWFDIKGLSLNAPEDSEGIKRATSKVHSLIEDEIKSGIPSNRVIIGGFSQGGGLALYSALTFDKPLAGVLALSCWLPLHESLPGNHSANFNTPILQCHGEEDPLIVLPIGRQTSKYLEAMNVKNLQFKVYSNMGHSSCDEEVKDIKSFVQRHLP